MMIGQLIELSLNASSLAFGYEQLAWPRKEEEFARFCDEANRFLSKMEIDARIPTVFFLHPMVYSVAAVTQFDLDWQKER